jgi:hypothetical protein
MRFLTVFGMEHPSVINGTVYNASYHGTRECGIKIKNSKSLYQKDSHQKIDKACELRRNLGLEEDPDRMAPRHTFAI